MNSTCLVVRPSASTSERSGSSSAKVRRSASGCSAISERITLVVVVVMRNLPLM
ncbi:hypothetical protein HFP72_11095 [Nocardiopsis sp. ARC36]